ncbi:N-acetylmuramoyl-L-alanine amidase, partial [bacterium]|nr:N-acetylmuramoyl-L-alanine amidase [bacterium]
LCDSLAPDVFVSLHHNSNAELDRDMNETQTYYPVGREGADLDLARSIHKHLVRNLEISPAKIMAGNFHVLRNATVPAVLGEPSMLSHPEVEKKLSAAQKQRLEAEAYFLGLLEYFEGGAPFWELVSDTTGWRAESITWRFMPDRGPIIDPMSIRLEVNGEEAGHIFDEDAMTVTWDARDFQGGTVALSLAARNLAGRSMQANRLSLSFCPACGFEHQIIPTTSDHLGPYLFSWKHAKGYPHDLYYKPEGSDSVIALGRINAPYGAMLLKPGDDWSGRSISYITAAGEDLTYMSEGGYLFNRSDARPEVHWHILVDPKNNQEIPGDHWTLRRYPGSDVLGRAISYYLRTDRPAFCSIPDHSAWLEIRGARPILVDALHKTPWQEPCDLPRDTLVWHPLVPELVGKTIVIDPHGGAADTDGTAPMGTPGRELNLRVAERLAGLLRGAGADAVLTRDDPGFVPPEAKILLANETEADLFITLRRATPGAPGWSVGHHYGSSGGSFWGALLAETLGGFAAPDTIPVVGSNAYLLRHTACPAVDVAMPLPADLDSEERWRAPAYQQAVASALMSATAAWFQGEDLLLSLADPRTFISEHTAAATLVDGCDWIRVDGNWLWLPPRRETVPAALLPLPGDQHTFEVRRDDRWELLVSGSGEGDVTRVWPFWTSERRPTNPFAETDATHEASGP